MEIYLVGGAVRDKLLGRPVKERDWVVVGATPEEMVALGYKPVGKDFPVFLHPETHEEYALARTERKTAPGYKGFVVHADVDVTLQQDLQRRDLTINAIAETSEGEAVDPYGGCNDLEKRVLRHVSPAFAEDPVRVLRVARFAARYKHLGFKVADETLALMKHMVANSEVDALVPERVWQELVKALSEDTPSEFFEVLRACGALAVLFPEIECLYGVPQPEKWHPEIDTGVHVMMVVDQAARISDDLMVRFAALTHDLGKGSTPRDIWPSHHGHEKRSVELVEQLCDRYKAPNAYRDLARKVARFHGRVHKAEELRSSTLLKTLQELDVFRRADVLEQFLLACEADHRGRTGFEERPYPQAAVFRKAYQAAASVDPGPLVEQGMQGQGIADALYRLRLNAVKASRNNAEIDQGEQADTEY